MRYLGSHCNATIRDFESRNRSRGTTYTGVAIENVHAIPGVQVVYSTFTVDFESVYPNDEGSSVTRILENTYVRPS